MNSAEMVMDYVSRGQKQGRRDNGQFTKKIEVLGLVSEFGESATNRNPSVYLGLILPEVYTSEPELIGIWGIEMLSPAAQESAKGKLHLRATKKGLTNWGNLRGINEGLMKMIRLCSQEDWRAGYDPWRNGRNKFGANQGYYAEYVVRQYLGLPDRGIVRNKREAGMPDAYLPDGTKIEIKCFVGNCRPQMRCWDWV